MRVRELDGYFWKPVGRPMCNVLREKLYTVCPGQSAVTIKMRIKRPQKLVKHLFSERQMCSFIV